MKTRKFWNSIFTFVLLLAISQINVFGQSNDCINCNENNVTVGFNNSLSDAYMYQLIFGNNNITSRNNAVAIGSDSKASFSHSYVIGSSSESNGIKSFVIGSNSIAQSTYSFAIGYNAKSMFGNAFSVGNFVSSEATGGFVFGMGISSDEPLTNSVENSLLFGMKSSKPTLFVSESPYSETNDRTGKIGIGNMTDPQAKLHILSDENEAATLKLEHQTTGTKRFAQLFLGDHSIKAGNTENMVFSTPTADKHFVFENGNVGIGTASPEADLHVQGNMKMGSNIGEVGTNAFAGGDGSTARGTNAFAFGENSNASGTDAVSIGFWSEATSDKSFALGFYNQSNTAFSYLFGQWLKSTVSSNITIGFGAGQSPLVNNKHRSLMMGMNSNFPTIYIGPSDGVGTTGKIGIGNITDPQAKLHIKADDNEDARLRLETSDAEKFSSIQFSENHEIKTRAEDNFHFSTKAETAFVFHQGDIFIEDIQKGIIMRSPSGQCWRGKLNDQGMLAFEQTTCPDGATSQPETMAPAKQLKVYPNPASGFVEVHTGTLTGKLALSLMDANGKQLLEQQAQAGKNILKLDGMPAGAYILVLKKDGKLLESTKLLVD